MSSRFDFGRRMRRWRNILGIILVLLVIFGLAALAWAATMYESDLKPVSNNQQSETVTIAPGTSTNQIGDMLHKDGLIRSSLAFDWYVRTHGLHSKLEAGTYSLTPSQGIPEIVNILTNGKVTTRLVKILPGMRIDQVRSELINAGFSPASVDAALIPSQYRGLPVISYKPSGANLEGLLYPDSFQRTTSTSPSQIVRESLTEMGQHLTPSLRQAFAKEGLTTYQAITLASIVEQEVSKPSDAAQAAQVFLKRLSIGMPLGSDVTAFYGAIINGQSPSVSYDSAYNTLIHKGLPPTPISNVDDEFLNAVAHPASTDWLYFVAGDNGITHFEKTASQHDADVSAYCHTKCVQDSQ